MTTMNVIGQVVFKAFTIGKNNVEIEVKWTESGKKGLQPLLGQSIEYPTRVFPRSEIRPGRGTGEHKVVFDKMNQDLTLEDRKEYAALVSWDGDPDRLPFILGVGSKEDFDKVTVHNKAVSEGKKVLHIVEDENLYEALIGDYQFRGTVTDIVTKATQEIGDDPVPELCREDLTTWKKKGGDGKYHPCSIPTLPTANKMLIRASAKKIAATRTARTA
jgi:hypothetical protein